MIPRTELFVKIPHIKIIASRVTKPNVYITGSQSMLIDHIPIMEDVSTQMNRVMYKKFRKANKVIAKNLPYIYIGRDIGFDKYKSISPLEIKDTTSDDVLNIDTRINIDATEPAT
jgi:hypothetical protein